MVYFSGLRDSDVFEPKATGKLNKVITTGLCSIFLF
jgi:hypothetical protein